MTVITAEPGKPAVYPLPIKQGAVFQLTVNIQDQDGGIRTLTGFTAEMQIRAYVEATDTLAEFSTTEGSIAITPATGEVVVTIGGAETSTYEWRHGKYDLFIFDSSGQPECVLQGAVTVDPAVTR